MPFGNFFKASQDEDTACLVAIACCVVGCLVGLTAVWVAIYGTLHDKPVSGTIMALASVGTLLIGGGAVAVINRDHGKPTDPPQG